MKYNGRFIIIPDTEGMNPTDPITIEVRKGIRTLTTIDSTVEDANTTGLQAAKDFIDSLDSQMGSE